MFQAGRSGSPLIQSISLPFNDHLLTTSSIATHRRTTL